MVSPLVININNRYSPISAGRLQAFDSDGNIKQVSKPVNRLQHAGPETLHAICAKADYDNVLISIQLKSLVAHVVGVLKGKSAIRIARTFMNRKKNVMGESFWARGYSVPAMGKVLHVTGDWSCFQTGQDMCSWAGQRGNMEGHPYVAQ
jgi:REP element-mobilizing transposase RayT